MRLLAIDTALAACSAAIFDTEVGMIAADSRPMVRGHAEALMPLIERLMIAAKTKFADIDRIAVTVGPGSFTGLRVGVAAARGIALVANKPAVAVTTLKAFAAPHLSGEGQPPVLAAIDARNDNVYMEVFGAGGTSLHAARLASLKDAVQAIAPGPAVVVGSAATLVAAAWPEWMPSSWVKATAAPDIAWVARLGAEAEVGDTPPKPFYLREPDYRTQDGAQVSRQ